MYRGVDNGRAARLRGRLVDVAGGRRRLAVLALILLVGLGLRVEAAVDPPASPTPDARGYAQIAESLHRDGSFQQRGDFLPTDVQEPSNYSPGLPLFVAGIYEVRGGVDLRLARIVLALIGSLAVLFAFLIGRRLAGPDAGLIAAGAVAIYPAFMEYQGMLMTEPLAATLLSGAMLACMRAAEAERPAAWVLPGLLLGALAMVRPEYLLIGLASPLLALLLVRRKSGAQEGLRAAAAMGVAFVLVLVPWSVRNLIVLDRFVPISTGGGKVLFIGTHLATGGDGVDVEQFLVETKPWLRRAVAKSHPQAVSSLAGPRPLLSQADPPPEGLSPRLRLSQRFDDDEYLYIESVLEVFAARRHPEVSSDVALGRIGRENLLRHVEERPLDLVSMMSRKAWEAWRYGPRDVMEQARWAALHAAIAILGLLGIAVLAARRRWEGVVLVVLVLAITAMCALLIASPRRVLLMVPLLAATGAAFAVWAWEALARRSPRRA